MGKKILCVAKITLQIMKNTGKKSAKPERKSVTDK